ncbi:uncharacterized protein LOC112528746 [Cynara cardunculus var. scolymus]|uniref:Uncharacterized protein n=1 Tax=Cynara cardunculus var. scolymus TaxID=59895 RepID=A0A118JWY4_CYNCS|nr:uncharacterized protein LOC112528746 [Cynara cardunculus var. scolymus]KVH95127.1 hypothetical protein Ccrd_002846 [Cynara cardunculus var. scolymus]
MTNKSPIFPIHEPHHFSDYGFDPQIHYFQVLEEARNHKRESSSSWSSRSAIDNLHFKLQKPNSKDDTSKKIKKTRKRWWWKNALLFFKRKRTPSDDDDYPPSYNCVYGGAGVRALSGPVYLAESRSGSSTPYHRTSTSRPSSGPLAGTFNIPYISLTELNMDPTRKISASPMPIYLVT